MWWTCFWAVFVKELRHITRDRRTIGLAVALPFLQLVMFGYLDTNARDLPTSVVDQDHTRESRLLVDKLRASRTFAIDSVMSSPSEARMQIISGRARVGVLIPPDFHNKRSRGEPAPVMMLLDGSDNVVSTQALAAANGIAAELDATEHPDLARKEPVQIQSLMLFNAEGRTPNFLIPAMIVILLQLAGTMFTALSIVREREQGTLDQLLVAPTSPMPLMLGKVLPFVFVGYFQLTLVLVLMRFGFDVPIHGSIGLLYALSSVYIFAILALGLFISTRAKTQAQALQMSSMLLLPSVFLSGYVFPRSGLPPALIAIGELLPATHMIAIIRGIVQRDAGIDQMAWNVEMLVIVCVALLILSVRNFRKVT